MAAATLKAGEPEHLWWWALALPMLAWMVSPGAAAYFIAAERRSKPRLFVMVLYFAAFALTAAVGYYEGLISPQSSTASLITIFLPLYQWGAFLMVLLLLALFEWMMDQLHGKS